jgi:hypothetical protein
VVALAQHTITGPLRTIEGPDGVQASFYVIPFDKDGTCTGPQSRDMLVAAAQNATDVFVFTHGWNTDWASAIRHYDTFITDFLQLRGQTWPVPDRPYRPLLVGVFWPSAALITHDEEAPDIAGEPGPEEPLDLDDLAAAMSAQDAALLRDLAGRESVDAQDALTLARLLCSQLGADDEEPDGTQAAPAPEALVAAGFAMEGARAPDAEPSSSPTGHLLIEPDEPSEPGEDGVSSPIQAAFSLGGIKPSDLNPRNLIRLATVLRMKDRAGTVGARGVADMLIRIQNAPQSPAGGEAGGAAPRRRIHLIGHSYGAKVVLSALAAPAGGTLTVDSVLLLQPAVSAYCFAPTGAVPGTGRAGGYEPCLHRTRLPLVTTFSENDWPLNNAYELAARRTRDLGEVEIAGGPSKYSALGGGGPLETKAVTVPAVRPTTPYNLPVAPLGHLIAIRGDDVISGHGDITSPATAWMLLSQVRS